MDQHILQTPVLAQRTVANVIAEHYALDNCIYEICHQLETETHYSPLKVFIFVEDATRLYVYFRDGSSENSGTLSKVDCPSHLAQNLQVEWVSEDAQELKSMLPDGINQVRYDNYLPKCWCFPLNNRGGNQFISSIVVCGDYTVAPTDRDRSTLALYQTLISLSLEKERKSTTVSALNKQLFSALNRLQVIHNVLPDLGLVLSEDGNYVDVYGSKDLLVIKDLDKLIGQNVQKVLPQKVADDVIKVVHRALSSGTVQVFEYELDVASGHRVFEARVAPIEQYNLEHPERRHVILMARDITERKQSEEQMEKMAFYDPLTDLPNRRLLMDRLQHIVEQVKRCNSVGALIFVDLDGFKQVNDNFGHDVGDGLLMEVANRLKQSLRTADTVARFGGDEFIIVLEKFTDDMNAMAEEVRIVAQRIMKSLKKGIQVNGQPLLINASLGVTMISGLQLSADGIIKQADDAMYQAKHAGKGRICFYNAS